MPKPALVFLALALAAAPASAQAPAVAPIDSMAVRAHTYFLAHDLLRGRATGSHGARVAAWYLATSAERLGLRGAGADGSFFQSVPLVDAAIDTAGTTFSLTDSTGTTVFHSPEWFIPNVGTLRTLVDFGGAPAWVGTARDILAHPGQLPPLAGRVAIMAGAFGRDLAAADTLRARGVRGVIQFVGSADTYRLYVRSRGASRLSVDDSTVVSSFIPDLPMLIASGDLVRRILPPDVNEDALQHPFAIEGRTVQVRIAVQARRIAGRNVAAVLDGTDPTLRNEYVVYTAHYDHLGVGEPDARGDSIFNGFSDNAAGSAMLLAIAEAFAAHRPARSVLFLWFTGEERGLLGSDYFSAHPVVPPARMAGVINLDAGAPPARVASWRISGGALSELGPLAIRVAQEAGWTAENAPASPNTDYYPFLRLGVPAVFLVPAPGPYEGLTTDSSNALRRIWDHYHQQADNWAADFPFEGLVRYADYARRIGVALASGPRLPPAAHP